MLRNLLLLCLGITLFNARLNAQELISWHEELGQARQISQQYKVPILLHFYGDNCMPCKMLEKNVFTRPEVASTIQRYFVPVHINATQDRRTATQYGVHSWPTDVFLSPDGQVLTQGVCNQNPGAYLQNLQGVAVMNRDRNLMLAGHTPPGSIDSPAQAAPPLSATPISASTPPQPAANPYAAPQASNLPASAGSGSGNPATEASAAAPYGRLASASLQQEAPGRDHAPAPYSNPSSGANPYATGAPTPGLASAGQSGLPSPTWNGQSAHGQATSGLPGAGPLANNATMNAPAATPGTSLDHKDPNLPQAAQRPAGLYQAGNSAPTLAAIPPRSAAGTTHPGLASAPALPPAATPAPAPSTSAFARNTASHTPGAVVENPHYGSTAPTHNSQPGVSESAPQTPDLMGTLARTVSTSSSVEKATPVAGPQQPASIPALSGYCPVALLSNSQWIEGNPQYAVRHRGRVYFLSSTEAAQKFLAAPDEYCPVLSGYDPLVLLRDGVLVEGSVYSGLKDATQSRIMLFSSAENKQYFQQNYDRLANELDQLLRPSAPLTAQAPANTLSR